MTINSTSPRELIDAELDTVSGGVADLGKYITKAVDDAISAVIGGNRGGGATAVNALGSVSNTASASAAQLYAKSGRPPAPGAAGAEGSS